MIFFTVKIICRDNDDIQDSPSVPKEKYQENLSNRESESDDVLYEAESTNIPIKGILDVRLYAWYYSIYIHACYFIKTMLADYKN